MATFRRRVLVAVLAALTSFVTVEVLASPAEAAGQDIPVEVTISTPDDAPIDGTMLVRLQSVLETGGTVYTTPQDTALLPTDGSSSRLVELEAPTSGYYTISVSLQGSTTRYLPTWLGGGGTAPASMDDPNIFLIDEQAQPSLGHAITLRRAQRISGVVRGTDGQPLGDVTVSSMMWQDGQLVSAGRDALTRKDGAYSVAVPPGTEASLQVRNRVGYAPWNLGGQGTTQTADNTLVMDQDRTQDITLTPDWSDLGASPRIVRDEACLTSSVSGTADLDGLLLDVSSKGYVVPQDTDYPVAANPLDIESDVPALVPYWSDTARPFTWGVADGRLCAVWRAKVGETMAYQLLLDSDGHATFNYGSISPNLYTAEAQAGWTEGSSTDDELVVLPRDGYDGYADGAATSLVAGSLGSDLPGTYAFVFTFDPPADRAAATLDAAPQILPASPVAGDTLVARKGTWSPTAGVTYEYQWMRDYTVIPGATDAAYETDPGEPGARYSVRVTARRSGMLPVTARTGVDLLGAAPTAPVPTVSGVNRPGARLWALPGAWTDDAVTTGYQWLRDGAPIVGATQRSYRLTAADVGRSIRVTVTGTADGRQPGRAVSRSTTIAKAQSTLWASVVDADRVGRESRVGLRVVAPGVAPSGLVWVMDGSTVVAARWLYGGQLGRTSLTLPRLTRGTHRYTAVYAGNAWSTRATSHPMTVTVR